MKILQHVEQLSTYAQLLISFQQMAWLCGIVGGTKLRAESAEAALPSCRPAVV
jgi:hypothetical protein